MELLGHRECIWLALVSATSFPVVVPIHTPMSNVWAFQLFHISSSSAPRQSRVSVGACEKPYCFLCSPDLHGLLSQCRHSAHARPSNLVTRFRCDLGQVLLLLSTFSHIWNENEGNCFPRGISDNQISWKILSWQKPHKWRAINYVWMNAYSLSIYPPPPAFFARLC